MLRDRFKRKKDDSVVSFLGAQTEFTGKLAFAGTVQLHGYFEGEIISRGTLVVGKESVVHATVHSNVLRIFGEVHGDLIAAERIELCAPAKVYGNLRTPRLAVEDGVLFEGGCSMSSVEVEIPALMDEGAQSGVDLDEDPLEAMSAGAWSSSYEERAEEPQGASHEEDLGIGKHD
jgi:cytoskeletal protein CcmA (bactofilin family)